jgi:hypothetical protein
MLDDILPIAFDPEKPPGYRINLACMGKLSPYGERWGYLPFMMKYPTLVEAKKIRKQIYKRIKMMYETNKKEINL